MGKKPTIADWMEKKVVAGDLGDALVGVDVGMLAMSLVLRQPWPWWLP
jgi:hypothetical protein